MSRDHDALRFAAAGSAALCTIVGIDGSFSRRIGAQLAVGVDGSLAGDMADKCLDAELASQAAAAMAEGTTRTLRYGEGSPFIDFRLPCGSGLDVLVDPTPDRAALDRALADLEARREAVLPLASDLLPERRYAPPLRIILLGAGAECAALEQLAGAQGIAIKRLEAGEGLSLGRAPADLAADRWTAVLLLFHDHEWEHALLDWALGTPAFYIGAQGGAPAREARLERLRTAGHGEDQLARVRAPVGLIPSARDPGVLALSILADVVGEYESAPSAQMNGPLAIALLAAGEARRFGGGKLDADLRGTPLGRHALDAALALDQGPVLVVVGDPVPAFVAGQPVELLANPHAAEGLGTSVALAAHHAEQSGALAVLLLAADMPLVSEATLRRLVDVCGPTTPSAARHPDGHPGIPACFPRAWFGRLQRLTGDQGAGRLLRGTDVRILAVPASELADVDTPGDLTQF